jgi:hypothetical protein
LGDTKRPVNQTAKERRDSLYFLLMGCIVFLLLGIGMESVSSTPMVDFKVLYYPAKCLLQHHDPYQPSEVLRLYQAEGVYRQLDTPKILQIVSQYLYFPSAFAITIPFALLSWGPAHLLWLALTIGSLILASFLIWDVAANDAPMLSALLTGLFLVNSGNLIALSNAAGIAIALCAIAVWCFMKDRWIAAGVICLAISLALKPQDAGLVWLYFLLSGGTHRKRALHTLGVILLIGAPGLLWTWHVAPHWIQEWHANAAAFSSHGGLNDPGPASTGRFGLGMLVNLSVFLSFFYDDPHFYNPASLLVASALFLLLMLAALRNRAQEQERWFALAAIAALSMLPVYHRQQDTKLLLLVIPACALLWNKGGAITRWLALLVSVTAFVVTGDILWIAVDVVFRLPLPLALRVFPIPLSLLALSLFYLWIYLNRSRNKERIATA